jgi:hypothetical protein
MPGQSAGLVDREDFLGSISEKVQIPIWAIGGGKSYTPKEKKHLASEGSPAFGGSRMMFFGDAVMKPTKRSDTMERTPNKKTDARHGLE